MTAKEAAKKHGPLVAALTSLLVALAALLPQLGDFLQAKAEALRAETKANAAAQLAAQNQVDSKASEKLFNVAIKNQADAIQDEYEARVKLELRIEKLESRHHSLHRHPAGGGRAEKPEPTPSIQKALASAEEAAKPRPKAKRSDPRVQAILKEAYTEEGLEE